MKRAITLLSLITLSSFASAKMSLDKLITPSGFNVDFYIQGIDNPRQMALSESGVIFVGSRRAGNVYAILDKNGDGKAETRWLVAEHLSQPSGLAYKDGDLYVADIGTIYRYKDILNHLDKPVKEVFFDELPDDMHHGWKFIRFSPDGHLIIPVGAPCNICEAPTKQHNRILSLDVNSKKLTVVAEGVRNSVGFDFHPQTAELWFSDNGRDMMGDDIPPDEINRVSQMGSHFGYPYVHGGDIKDPEFGQGKDPANYVQPELKLGAHVAPLGIEFYNGKSFPSQYHNQLFVTEHGSWNRSKKVGYKVAVATIENNNIVNYTPVISGFMKDEETFGRPAAILELPDGSLLISDDYANVIYRLTYQKP